MHMTRFGFAAGLLVTVAAAQASVVISDDFSLTGTGRTAGAAVNGTTTPVGNSTWIASTGVTFGGNSTNGDVVFTGNQVAAVKAPTSADTLQVSMDVHPTPAAPQGETSGWLAVGMGSSSGSNTWNSGIFLLLQPVSWRGEYKYQLMQNINGALTQLSQADTTVAIGTTTTVSLTLAYTKSTNTVNAWWNSTLITTSPINLGTFTPTINYVGFSSASVDSAAFADNFAVDVTPVPEPASIGLLALAGLALLSTAKKSRM